MHSWTLPVVLRRPPLPWTSANGLLKILGTQLMGRVDCPVCSCTEGTPRLAKFLNDNRSFARVHRDPCACSAFRDLTSLERAPSRLPRHNVYTFQTCNKTSIFFTKGISPLKYRNKADTAASLVALRLVDEQQSRALTIICNSTFTNISSALLSLIHNFQEKRSIFF